MNKGKSCHVKIKVLFFAKARELTGKSETFIEVSDNIKGTDLLDLVVTRFNLDSIRGNVILAVNESWVDLDSELKLGELDEVAIVPPLSGGINLRYLSMDQVKLTKDKLNVEDIYNSVCSPEYGAVNLFVGTTRNNFDGKIVEKLEYEAYEGMAVKSLEGLCKSIRKKFEVGNIAIYHRLGDVPVKEASVVIAISAPHRKPVFEAVVYAIDALKADVPIWKKEIYQGNESPQWKENSESKGSTHYIVNTADTVQVREEIVEAENFDNVPPDLIQINTNLQEINRRITSFISRKRHQVDISNIQDFCVLPSENEDDCTCARTNAVLFRRKDSKTHLKVHRVENSTGPRIKPYEYTYSTQYPESAGTCPSGAEERLTNAEYYLNVKADSLNVFSRLKAIEDRILYLESISPEYFDFVRQKPMSNTPKLNMNTTAKRVYSSADIDVKLQQLESKFNRKC